MKKINCPCCGKELINLAVKIEYPRFWCDDCNLEISSRWHQSESKERRKADDLAHKLKDVERRLMQNDKA